MGPLWIELPVARVFFYISLEPAFESPVIDPPPPGSPVGPRWREMPVSRAFLYISFRVSSKGAPLQVPLTDHQWREMLRFWSLPSSVSQESPVNETPPGTLWRELPISRAFFYVSLRFPIKSSPDRKISPFILSSWERIFPPRVPSKGALPPGSPHRSPTERERLCFQSPPPISQSPW